MQSFRFWHPFLAFGMVACGARVSVGDLGNGPASGSGSAGADAQAGTGAAGASVTGGAGASAAGAAGASATVTAGAGSGTSTGAGGAAGGPNAPTEAGRDVSDASPGSPNADVNVVTDVGNLGGAGCGGIEYPAAAFYGENFLPASYAWVAPGATMEMAAKLALGATLRIRMTLLSGSVWQFGGRRL